MFSHASTGGDGDDGTISSAAAGPSPTPLSPRRAYGSSVLMSWTPRTIGTSGSLDAAQAQRRHQQRLSQPLNDLLFPELLDR